MSSLLFLIQQLVKHKHTWAHYNANPHILIREKAYFPQLFPFLCVMHAKYSEKMERGEREEPRLKIRHCFLVPSLLLLFYPYINITCFLQKEDLCVTTPAFYNSTNSTVPLNLLCFYGFGIPVLNSFFPGCLPFLFRFTEWTGSSAFMYVPAAVGSFYFS